MREPHLMGVSDEAAMEAYRLTFPSWAASAARKVPDYMLPGLARWIMWGIYPGDFLTAVIHDSLKEAAMRADVNNQRLLWQWADVMYNCVPNEAQGSIQLAKDWNKRGGVCGRCNECGQPRGTDGKCMGCGKDVTP
jgi:hypothetical protein